MKHVQKTGQLGCEVVLDDVHGNHVISVDTVDDDAQTLAYASNSNGNKNDDSDQILRNAAAKVEQDQLPRAWTLAPFVGLVGEAYESRHVTPLYCTMT